MADDKTKQFLLDRFNEYAKFPPDNRGQLGMLEAYLEAYESIYKEGEDGELHEAYARAREAHKHRDALRNDRRATLERADRVPSDQRPNENPRQERQDRIARGESEVPPERRAHPRKNIDVKQDS